MSSMCLFAGVKRVSITLRLPLATLKAFEDSPNTGNTAIWTSLFSALADLSELRTLQIWLDHDDEASWMNVNERAVLAALTPLSSKSSLDVSINLPMLHPGLESADRHFVPDEPAPAFSIHRRLRQRLFGNKDGKNGHIVTTVNDFPFLTEADGFEEMPLQRLEELERRYWKSGMDVEAEVNDIGMTMCY